MYNSTHRKHYVRLLYKQVFKRLTVEVTAGVPEQQLRNYKRTIKQRITYALKAVKTTCEIAHKTTSGNNSACLHVNNSACPHEKQEVDVAMRLFPQKRK